MAEGEFGGILDHIYGYKKIKDYYVLINFSYLLPQIDKKFVYQVMNDRVKDYRENIETKSMFHTAVGLHDNAEIKEDSK